MRLPWFIHPNQIQIISISDNPEIPNALRPEQPDLAAAIRAAIDSHPERLRQRFTEWINSRLK